MDDNNTISFHKTVTITIQDQVSCVITGLLAPHLDFFVNEYNLLAENYFFKPKYKLGLWDGRIPFFSKTGKTYKNLLPNIIPKLTKLGYKIILNDKRPNINYDVDDIDNTYFSDYINPKNNQPYILEDHQVNAANAVFANNGGIIIAGTGFGKAQPLTSNVLTQTGWKEMGDIFPGEIIFTPKNKRVKVLEVFPQGETDVYKITFKDGASTEADGNHIWTCYNPNAHSWNTKPFVQFTTLELKERNDTLISKAANTQIPIIQQEIDFGKQQLPFDPYYFGILLAHLGLTDKGEYKFTCFSPEIYNILTPFFNHYGVYLTKVKQHHEFNFDDDTNQNTALFFEYLRELIGTDIRVPFIYKYASVEQRKLFFNGICDCQGFLTDQGVIVIESVRNIPLLEDLRDMVWLSGGVCSVGATKGTLKIYHPNPTSYFLNTSKLEKFVEYGHSVESGYLRRTIEKIEYIGKKETQCILIDDPEHLYITDDCIVTHNTILNAAIVDRYNKAHGVHTLTVVPSTSLINQTAAQFELLGLDVGCFDGTRKDTNEQHIISTWQTLKNYAPLMTQFQLVVVDECHGAQAASLNNLLIKNGSRIPLRVGLTGTLPKHETTKTTVHMALGNTIYTKVAHELIESGWLATPNISIMQLDDQKFLIDQGMELDTIADFEYSDHLKLLQLNDDRLKWISEFIYEKGNIDEKGNILCLVGNVKYGKKLQKLIPGSIFLYGADKEKVRKQVYDLFETNDHLIVICTQQIAGVGLSIDRIFNLIFIDMGKSYIKVIQAIGRGLRKGRDKDSVNVIDICSTLPYAAKHLRTRIKYYKEARYPFKKYLVTYNEQGCE